MTLNNLLEKMFSFILEVCSIFFFSDTGHLGKYRQEKRGKLLFPSVIQGVEVLRSNKYPHFSLSVIGVLHYTCKRSEEEIQS